RHSIESGSSGSTSKHASTPQYQHRRRNSRDSMSSSPAPSSVAPPYQHQQSQQQQQHQPLSNTTSFAHMSISNIGGTTEPSSPSHQQNSNVQAGGKFSTTSSCTSGFASGTGESLVDHQPFNNSLITNRQRPVWWGTSEPTTRIGIDEVKQLSPTRTQRILAETHSNESSIDRSPDEKTPTLPQRKEQSPQDSAVLGRSTPPDAVETTPPKSIQKAIRMDFDFNAPVENAIADKEKTPPKLPSKTSATAFTVTFDNETAKKPVSLQDAARQAPTSRRMARRSVP
uniref:Uncharacterized protein n=1 Tax=Panagrolaimus sp. PS1159 TaxID=55785 RepID=A0AC35GR84_9BILA